MRLLLYSTNLHCNRVGTNPPEPLSPHLDGEAGGLGAGYHHNSHHAHHNPIVNRSGQILWIRGLTRLQTQVSTKLVQSGKIVETVSIA